MSETTINGIDVSEYFIEVVDEGGGTIDYKILPNSERLLVKKIFEQNQQYKRLQEENEDLKTYIQKMDKPEIKTIDSEIALKNIELQQENEKNKKTKKQYNCYACGNCNGKEDYINLEKHHKGLRKQFDELAKRNNTLSLRIEELENEKEELKKYIGGFVSNCRYCDEWYMDKCNYIKKENNCKQALKEIREEVGDLKDINKLINLQKILDIINEVLNENRN